jgi:hypothetical protein
VIGSHTRASVGSRDDPMGARIDQEIDQLLAALADHLGRTEHADLRPGQPSALVASMEGEQADAALREALHRGLIDGERTDNGRRRSWRRLRITVDGLRLIGHWPPPGLEHHPGPWDEGVYGAAARPLLVGLRDNPPRHGHVSGPHLGMSDDALRDWRVIELLLEADLLDGTETSTGSLIDVRLTSAGMEALDPSDRDPLDTAARKLRTGAKIEAVVSAVEAALGPRLVALAEAAGIATSRDGKPAKLSALNDQLKKVGVLSEADRTAVESYLKRRNDCAHGDDEKVSYAQAELVIVGVRVFLEEHPVAP